VKIRNLHPDRTKLAFPRGIPEDFTLEDINPRLQRVGLYAKTKNPGVSYELALLSSVHNICYSGKCRDIWCRKLHDISEEKTAFYYSENHERVEDGLISNLWGALAQTQRRGLFSVVVQAYCATKIYLLQARPPRTEIQIVQDTVNLYNAGTISQSVLLETLGLTEFGDE